MVFPTAQQKGSPSRLGFWGFGSCRCLEPPIRASGEPFMGASRPPMGAPMSAASRQPPVSMRASMPASHDSLPRELPSLRAFHESLSHCLNHASPGRGFGRCFWTLVSCPRVAFYNYLCVSHQSWASQYESFPWDAPMRARAFHESLPSAVRASHESLPRPWKPSMTSVRASRETHDSLPWEALCRWCFAPGSSRDALAVAFSDSMWWLLDSPLVLVCQKVPRVTGVGSPGRETCSRGWSFGKGRQRRSSREVMREVLRRSREKRSWKVIWVVLKTCCERDAVVVFEGLCSWVVRACKRKGIRVRGSYQVLVGILCAETRNELQWKVQAHSGERRWNLIRGPLNRTVFYKVSGSMLVSGVYLREEACVLRSIFLVSPTGMDPTYGL